MKERLETPTKQGSLASTWAKTTIKPGNAKRINASIFRIFGPCLTHGVFGKAEKQQHDQGNSLPAMGNESVSKLIQFLN